MVLTRSTEGLSAPLASLYTVFFGGISIIRLSSYRHKALAFPLGQRYSLPHDFRSFYFSCSCHPICALERMKGIGPSRPVWKTGILPLNYIRIVSFSLDFLHIYYTRNFKKLQILFVYGGRWWNRTTESRATTCRFTTRLTTHMEQVTGIGPVSQPWQGRIITAILYLHNQGTSTDLNRFDFCGREIV